MKQLDPVWFELGDGCRLAARVWLPDDALARPAPAILEAVPYRRNDGTYTLDHPRYAYWAGRGFAGVRLDIRGSGDSDGLLVDEYLAQEQDDACEVIAQIAAMPWCSGRVAMLGFSWGGFAGLQVAARCPPALGAVVSVNSTTRRYTDDCHYVGGAICASDLLGWATTMRAIQAMPPDPAVVGERWREQWMQRLDAQPAFIDAWITHQLEDDYWRHGSVAFDWNAIDVPVLAVGGLADPYRNAVFELVESLPGVCEGLLGPWAHGYPNLVGPGPQIGFLSEVASFLGHHLRGDERPKMPRLRAFVARPDPPRAAARTGRFIGLDAVPTSTLELHLHASALVPGPPPGPLAIGVPSDLRAGLSAGNWCPYGESVGPTDQRNDDAHSTCFETSPLTNALTIVGMPRLRLELSSGRPLAQLTARLCSVAPDGTSLLLGRGTLNLTHRLGHDRTVPLVPGQPVQVEVRIDALCHEIPIGHALRLALSPASWPWIWPSPELATLTVHHGQLLLPHLTALAPTWVPPPPEQSEPVEVIGLEAPAGRDEINWEGGVATITSEPDYLGGRRRVVDLGIEVGEWGTDTHRIDVNDPLSASVACHRGIELVCGNWSVRVEVDATLRCTAGDFLVTTHLAASDADGPVAERTTQTRVPRSGA